MENRPRANSNASDESIEQDPVKKVEKIIVVPGSGDLDTAVTFEIRSEDHTLGNALRFNAMRDPHVTMSAYNVPHPLETKMHLRIETRQGTPRDALKSALDLTISQCDDLLKRFDKEFKSVQ